MVGRKRRGEGEERVNNMVLGREMKGGKGSLSCLGRASHLQCIASGNDVLRPTFIYLFPND